MADGHRGAGIFLKDGSVAQYLGNLLGSLKTYCSGNFSNGVVPSSGLSELWICVCNLLTYSRGAFLSKRIDSQFT